MSGHRPIGVNQPNPVVEARRRLAAITNDAIRTRIVRLIEALAEDSAEHQAEE